MTNPRNAKVRNHDDGSGITYATLLKFTEAAYKDLAKDGKEDAAYYFEQFNEWLKTDYTPSKSFVYTSRVLGL